MSSEVVNQILFVDATTGNPVQLATTRAAGVDKLQVDATGIGPVTLDPTNLALDATIVTLTAAINKMLAPVLGTALKVAVQSTHQESAAVGVTSILLVSTSNCHIVVADTPVATANDFYLPAGVILRLLCQTTNKVSVIRDTADGSLFVSPAV